MKIPRPPKHSPFRRLQAGRLIVDPYTGEADTIGNWAERYGITENTLRAYLRKNSWDDFFTFYPVVQKSCDAHNRRTRRVRR